MIVKIISKGAVYKKSVGKHSYWYYVVEYLDENGKKGKKYIRGFNAKDAREKGNQFMAEFNSVKAQYSRKTLNEIFDELIAVKQLSTPIRDSSVITLRSTYNNNIRDSIGNIPMCELTTMTIQSLLDDVCRCSERGFRVARNHLDGGADVARSRRARNRRAVRP